MVADEVAELIDWPIDGLKKKEVLSSKDVANARLDLDAALSNVGDLSQIVEKRNMSVSYLGGLQNKIIHEEIAMKFTCALGGAWLSKIRCCRLFLESCVLRQLPAVL